MAGSAQATFARPTSLTVTYWPHGQASPGKKVWTLKCTPTGGTHPARVTACAELAALPHALGPATRPCSYAIVRGAPATLVTGTFRGTKVNRLFRPGCDPWSKLHALLIGR